MRPLATAYRFLRRYWPAFDSLAARLIGSAAVWAGLGFVIGGLALSGVFRDAEDNNFDQRLTADLGFMIAAAQPDPDGGVLLPKARFNDARYGRVYSGWYWEIVPVSHGTVQYDAGQFSRSLFDRAIRPKDAMRALSKADPRIVGYADGPEAQRLRYVARRISFPVLSTEAPGDERGWLFLVAGDTAQLAAATQRFDQTLAIAFAIVFFVLVGAVFFQVRVGLRPLHRLSAALARIRDGKARRLEGRFPAELTPLADELNGLIEHSAEVVGRARTHVSNLAHALKTPLSVLASEAAANPSPLGDAVMRQVEAMRRHVDHYLTRARAAGALDVLGTRSPAGPALNDLARVLRRIHAARGITIDVDCPAGLAFRGEKQDLEEMAGNLIDNACKWARGRVGVFARLKAGKLVITVGDDGPGLTEDERQRVGARGERLDESVPGTGLGLAITRDIAKLYGGALDLGQSQLGGLEARLTLPAG